MQMFQSFPLFPWEWVDTPKVLVLRLPCQHAKVQITIHFASCTLQFEIGDGNNSVTQFIRKV